MVDRLLAEGRLRFYAGRLQVLEADATGVQALFRRRGTIQHVSLHVAKIINCTGPRTDYSKYQHRMALSRNTLVSSDCDEGFLCTDDGVC